jgi:myo-inositol-1(or 4)-monophosphatase
MKARPPKERGVVAQFIETCGLAARRGGLAILQMATPRLVRTKSPRDLVTEADLAAQRAIFACIRESFPTHFLLGEEFDETAVAQADRAAHSETYVWAVDPLDGTTNFVHNIPYWCVSVALLRDGEPIAAAIFDPLRDECFLAEVGAGASLDGAPLRTSGQDQLNQAVVGCSFSAEVTRDSAEVARFLDLLPYARALRRMGSTALNLAYVAAGRLDGFFTSQTNAWDVAAGGLMVREAGGEVRAVQGNRWRPLVDATVIATASEGLLHEISRCWQPAE